MSYQNSYLTNTKIRLMNELSATSYLPNMKDYIVNLIIQLLSYQHKSPTQNPRYLINNFFGQDKIVMVVLPMSIPFNNRAFDVPIQIYLMKNIPYEPPQIFIEVNQSTGINTKNTDIDANTKRVLVNSLRTWNQYSELEKVLNDIRESFRKNFPVFKKTQNTIANNNNNNNFYNVINQGIQNLQINQGMYYSGGTSIYGQPMGNNAINNANNNYYNNANNNNGIPPQMNFSNKNVNAGVNLNNPNIINNNNVSNNTNNNNAEVQIKNIMINEIVSKVINLIKFERNKINQQKIKLGNFKNNFIQETEKINNYLNKYNEIENSMNNDLNYINNEIQNTNNYLINNNNSNKEITKDNCLNFINVSDNNNVLNLIAKEAFYEEMNQFIKKAASKKMIDFMSAMQFQRNLARNQFINKYLLEKFTK